SDIAGNSFNISGKIASLTGGIIGGKRVMKSVKYFTSRFDPEFQSSTKDFQEDDLKLTYTKFIHVFVTSALNGDNIEDLRVISTLLN
ncbi:MAG: hypothetical protein MHPSP_004671, partial [Paramarteilia canceri]